MYDNDATPTEAELKEWAKDTDSNRHRDVRAKIAKWAAKNADDTRVKRLCKTLGKTVDEIYEDGTLTGGIGPKDFEVACKMTNVLLMVIRQEFGSETADAIEKCL